MVVEFDFNALPPLSHRPRAVLSLSKFTAIVCLTTGMAPNPVIVFVARASVRDEPDEDAARTWLRESLSPVAHSMRRSMAFGVAILAFTLLFKTPTNVDSRRPPTHLFFTGLIDERGRENRELILVLRGWDASTVRESDFHRIFKRCSDLAINMRVKVFVDDNPRSTRRFFDVNVI